MKIRHRSILKLIIFNSYFVFLNEIELTALLIIPNGLFYITQNMLKLAFKRRKIFIQ